MTDYNEEPTPGAVDKSYSPPFDNNKLPETGDEIFNMVPTDHTPDDNEAEVTLEPPKNPEDPQNNLEVKPTEPYGEQPNPLVIEKPIE